MAQQQAAGKVNFGGFMPTINQQKKRRTHKECAVCVKGPEP